MLCTVAVYSKLRARPSYELLLTTADGTYKLSKRYSEFEAFQRAIKKDIADAERLGGDAADPISVREKSWVQGKDMNVQTS